MRGFLFTTALKSLWKSPQRTLLTLLGIIVGTLTLVVVLSVGNGVKGFVLAQLGSLSADSVFVEVQAPADAGNALTALSIQTMKLRDKDQIEKLPNVQAVSVWYTGQGQLKNEINDKITTLIGTNYTYTETQNLDVEFGRFFTESEDNLSKRVIVLGRTIAEDLSRDDPKSLVGKNLKLEGKNFRVVGVLESQGSQGFIDPDSIALIPIKVGQKQLWGVDHVQAMIVKVKDIGLFDQTSWRIKKILRRNHNIDDPKDDDFRVMNYSEVMEIVGTVTAGISLLLSVVAGISLVVGGIGIMNVMYVTVAERTSEIGLRKAIGAKPSSILWQFLIEAIIITLIGGILGVLIGLGITWGANQIVNNLGYDLVLSLTYMSVLGPLAVNVILGIVFGLAPARKAAKMDPIVALREE